MADERRPHGAQRSSIAEKKYAMTCEEVAQSLGISAQHVSQLQVRALKKLRKGLLARGYDTEVLELPTSALRLILGIALSEYEKSG